MEPYDVMALTMISVAQIVAALPDAHLTGDVVVAAVLAGIKWSDHERGKRRDRSANVALTRISDEIAGIKTEVIALGRDVAVLKDRSKNGRVGD